MNLQVRRVVTGHDAEGKAVVVIDETLSNVTSRRPGQEACVVWAADSIPADNADPADTSGQSVTSLPNGAVFRVVRYSPETVGRMHRTKTVDYGVVISGSIVLELDDGVEVTLNAGDVLVQRGTIHNWINRSDQPCTVAFVLVDALPLVIDGLDH